MPSLFFADLVRERCVATGAGPLALGGALPGHRSFAAAVPADASFHYSIAGVTHAGEWEVGTGAIDAEGRLRRDVVAASSNGGAAVAFAAGLKTVALTVGAGWFAASEAAVAAAGSGTSANAAELAALGATVAGQAAAIAAHETAIAGKQPLSTGHAAAGAVEAADSLTLRRAGGWVNVPASALVHQRGGGGFSCAGNLGVGDEAPAQRLVVRASAATDGSAPVTIEIADTQAGGAGWTANAVFGALNFRSADGSVAGAGVRAQIAAAMPAAHGGQTDLRFGVSNAALLDRWAILDSSGRFRPGADNQQALGLTSFRWTAVYAATGTIQTSDARAKQWQGAMSAAEGRAARRIAGALGFYRWDDAIATKGDAARRHFGVRAQAAWAIMADEGLVDPVDGDGQPGRTPYAFLCFDRWQDEAGAWHDRFGVRSDQLALFLIAALAGTETAA